MHHDDSTCKTFTFTDQVPCSVIERKSGTIRMGKNILSILYWYVRHSTEAFLSTISANCLFTGMDQIQKHEELIDVHEFKHNGVSMRGVIATQVVYFQSRTSSKIFAFQNFLEYYCS